MPTLTALILGAIQISTAVENYTSFKRVQTLANLNALVVKGAGQLADERDITAGFVASGKSNTAMQAQVNQAQAATNATLAEISSQAAAVTGDSGYRAQTVLDLSNGVLAGINDLTLIRQAALKTAVPAARDHPDVRRAADRAVRHVQQRHRGRHGKRLDADQRHGAQRVAADGG